MMIYLRDPSPTVEAVIAVAARRIEAIMPDYKRRNVMARALETMMTCYPATNG